MSMIDSVIWDVEDYAGRIGNAVKEAASLAAAVVLTFPKTAFTTLAVALAISTIWAFSGSPAPTIQQQIVQHATQGGAVYWSMQAQGMNPTGFLGMSTYGNKKQEANFVSALRFCNGNKGFTGCDKVIAAVNDGGL